MTNDQKNRKMHQVSVCLTDEQRDYIIKRGIPVSTYLRSLLVNQMNDQLETLQLIDDLKQEIRRLGQVIATTTPPPVPSMPMQTLTIKQRTIEEREVSITGEQQAPSEMVIEEQEIIEGEEEEIRVEGGDRQATPEMLWELKEILKKWKVESWTPIPVKKEGN